MVGVVQDDEASAVSGCPRKWNFAKRLMTENFSNSWYSTLKSKTEVVFSNLHCKLKYKDKEREKKKMKNKKKKKRHV